MILESANKEGGSTKTKIMYKAFLSFAQLKEYLLILSQNDLLQYEEINQVYKTTTKGIQIWISTIILMNQAVPVLNKYTVVKYLSPIIYTSITPLIQE